MAVQHHNKKYVPVENHSGYSRDVRSRAIVSDNTSGYEAFVAKREKEKSFSNRLERVESTLDKILERLEKVSHYD